MPALKLTSVVEGLVSTLLAKSAPGDESRLFVVEQVGTIRVVKDGQLSPDPFLDVSKLTAPGGERGLLGLAFHPDYAQNGRFFIYYTDLSGNTVVAEYARGADADHADAGSAKVLLTQTQPEPNHNGGCLEFSPKDGMLYIGLGDGGGAGDQHGTIGNGQDLGTLLGKILRVDVSGSPYSIPAGNMTGAGVKPEIWDYGLRNPWRFAFDPCSGDLFIGDVGQNLHEEVDFEPAGQGNKNYGWRLMEGDACFNPSTDCDPEMKLTRPVFTYEHSEGCSISGGYVYRGSAIPALRGAYLFGDYCSGKVWGIRVTGGMAEPVIDLTTALGTAGTNITSFGQDAKGELYVVSASGQVWRVDPAM